MRSVALYSSSRHRQAPQAAAGSAEAPSETTTPKPPGRLRRFASQHERVLLLVLGSTLALAAMLIWSATQQRQRALTQEDIDASVLHTLENNRIAGRA